MDLVNDLNFSTHVNELLNDWHVPGVAIAVVQDDQVTSKGYGNACLERQTQMTADSLFDIASSSKSLTAASVALLVADNDNYPQVQWDTPVSKLLPDDFVMSDNDYTENVTVEDILSHRSGFPRHDYSYLSVRAEHPDSARSVTRNLRNLQNAAPFRSKYMYCNVMYTVATYLVEELSGLPFADFLKRHFFG